MAERVKQRRTAGTGTAEADPALLMANAGRFVRRALRGRPYRTEEGATVGGGEGQRFSAGLAITCVPLHAAPSDGPVLIIEAFSRETQVGCLGERVPTHQELPSVVEIWALDAWKRRVIHLAKSGDERWVEVHVRSGAFASPVLGGSVAFDELFGAAVS